LFPELGGADPVAAGMGEGLDTAEVNSTGVGPESDDGVILAKITKPDGGGDPLLVARTVNAEDDVELTAAVGNDCPNTAC